MAAMLSGNVSEAKDRIGRTCLRWRMRATGPASDRGEHGRHARRMCVRVGALAARAKRAEPLMLVARSLAQAWRNADIRHHPGLRSVACL